MRLVSVEDMVREFEVLGMDLGGFQALCEMLGVAVVHIGRDKYVEYYRFVLRFSAMLSQNEHIWLPRSRMPRAKPAPKIDEKKMEAVLKEMAATRAIAMKKSTPQMTDELRLAAQRWATAANRAKGARFAANPGQELELDDPRPD